MSNEIIPYYQDLPDIKNILTENMGRLTEIWQEELSKNSSIKASKSILNKNTKSFLQEILLSINEKSIPVIEKSEYQSIQKLLEMLKHQCLGENCSIQDSTTYLMTLKTAFLKFLQTYYKNHKLVLHKDFQYFANILDVLAFFLIQNYSELKEAEIFEFKKSSRIEFINNRIIGRSTAIKDVFRKIQHTLENDITVLIEGETGTGKELIAEAIHYLGNRNKGPFITINCAAIPENLLESELFGYEKGAFTGADQKKLGKFEVANEGTLFLDEIGELSLNMQVKLLRVLQTKNIVHLGGHENISVNARIIAATNKNLINEIKKNNFREDLYYRIAVFPIHVPPLRDRENDVLEIAEYFLSEENKRGIKKVKGFSTKALNDLKNYTWPGNIRELENVIRRAHVTTNSDTIDSKDLLFVNLSLLETEHSADDEEKTLSELERNAINKRIQKYDGNITLAAKSLGISRATLYNKINRKN